MREKTFNMRFGEDEWKEAEALAVHHGITVSALIRMLLKRELHAVAEKTRHERQTEALAEALIPDPAARRRFLKATKDPSIGRLAESLGKFGAAQNAGKSPKK